MYDWTSETATGVPPKTALRCRGLLYIHNSERCPQDCGNRLKVKVARLGRFGFGCAGPVGRIVSGIDRSLGQTRLPNLNSSQSRPTSIYWHP